MKRFLLDTGIAADYLNKRHGVFERARSEQAKGFPIGIGMPVIAELVYGVEKSSTREVNMRLLKSALNTLRLWPFDSRLHFVTVSCMSSCFGSVGPCR
jgi:tRNA(fMet)-specific endonuclease VapC